MAIDPTAHGLSIGKLQSDRGSVGSGLILGDDPYIPGDRSGRLEAPSSGRAHGLRPALQQYVPICYVCYYKIYLINHCILKVVL